MRDMDTITLAQAMHALAHETMGDEKPLHEMWRRMWTMPELKLDRPSPELMRELKAFYFLGAAQAMHTTLLAIKSKDRGPVDRLLDEVNMWWDWMEAGRSDGKPN